MSPEAAKELMQLEIWKSLGFEIDRLIAFEEKKLRICPIEQVDAVRMKIMAYESVKGIPQNVIDREEE